MSLWIFFSKTLATNSCFDLAKRVLLECLIILSFKAFFLVNCDAEIDLDFDAVHTWNVHVTAYL